MIEFIDPKEVLSLHLNHKENRVVLVYKKEILDREETYKQTLSEIMEQVDWCIRKSYSSSSDKS